jgi:hypothetical protein
VIRSDQKIAPGITVSLGPYSTSLIPVLIWYSLLTKSVSFWAPQQLHIGRPWSISFDILNIPYMLLFTLLNQPLLFLVPFQMLIGLTTLMIENQQAVLLFILFLILFPEVPRSILQFLSQVQRPNISPWQMLLLRLCGFRLSSVNFVSHVHEGFAFGVIIWEQNIYLLTRCFTVAWST